MEFHDVCNLFPMMADDEYRALVEDIRKHGLREPIVVWQGKIVDGRNRYRACMELGITPQYREWDGRGSLTAFVVSQNLHRRHLTASQKAVVALEIERMLAIEADERRAELGRQARLQHVVNGPKGSLNIERTFGKKDSEVQCTAVQTRRGKLKQRVRPNPCGKCCIFAHDLRCKPLDIRSPRTYSVRFARAEMRAAAYAKIERFPVPIEIER